MVMWEDFFRNRSISLDTNQPMRLWRPIGSLTLNGMSVNPYDSTIGTSCFFPTNSPYRWRLIAALVPKKVRSCFKNKSDRISRHRVVPSRKNSFTESPLFSRFTGTKACPISAKCFTSFQSISPSPFFVFNRQRLAENFDLSLIYTFLAKKSKIKKANRRAENDVFRAVFRRIDRFSLRQAAFSLRKALF